MWGRSLVQIAHFVHLFKDNLIYETTKVTQCVNFADKIQRPLHISLISCHVLQYFTPFNWFYTLGGNDSRLNEKSLSVECLNVFHFEYVHSGCETFTKD